MKSVERNRRPKQADLIIIDDDESSSDPANVKVEGEMKVERETKVEGESGGESIPVPPTLPSPDMAELREQAEKWERMFKRACRAAREAELRAERAENLLDSKRDVLENAEKKEKMDEMAEQLEEANRRAEAAINNEHELTRERDALKEQVEEIKRRNALSLQDENAILSQRLNALTQQMEQERTVSKQLRAVYRARIDELSAKLAESNRLAKPHGIASKLDRQVDKIVRMTELGKKESEKPTGHVSNHLDLPLVFIAPPPKKMARMEEMSDAAEMETQHLLQLQMQPLQPPIEPAVPDYFDSFSSLNDHPMNFEDETDPAEIHQEMHHDSPDKDFVGEDRDIEDAPTEIFSSDRGSKTKTVPFREAKKSETEMECPQCEFRSRSVGTWLSHLQCKHSTSPNVAGVALLCECGVECTSSKHCYRCDIANFTVIQKRQDAKTTPQCLLCDAYPKTACGYTRHLRRLHKTTLLENEIYLKCSCGLAVRTHHIDPNHSKNCDGLQYSIHKLGE